MIIKELTAYDCADGYTIGEDGTVYHNGSKLSSHLDHNGYYQIRIYNTYIHCNKCDEYYKIATNITIGLILSLIFSE